MVNIFFLYFECFGLSRNPNVSDFFIVNVNVYDIIISAIYHKIKAEKATTMDLYLYCLRHNISFLLYDVDNCSIPCYTVFSHIKKMNMSTVF